MSTPPDAPFRPCGASRHGPDLPGCVCDTPSMLEMALRWAAQGVPVFPLRPGQKEPLNRNGVLGASLDTDTITAWWTEHPKANIGGATGTPSMRWVVDIDGAVGQASLDEIEQKNGLLPVTTTSRTGRGRHLWFRMPVGVEIRNSASKIAPGIDVRGSGGYVVLPPSVHPDGGVYTLLVDAPPVEAPSWIVVAATAPKRPVASADHVRQEPGRSSGSQRGEAGAGGSDEARVRGMVRAACDRIRSTPEGKRNEVVNDECFAIGGWLDGMHASIDQVAPELEAAALAAEQPAAMVRRSLQDGRLEPRGRPPDTNREDATWHGDRPSPAPSGPPAWLVALRLGVETGDVKALYADQAVLVGVVRPGVHGGEVEALMLDLPHTARAALRRAGKAIVMAERSVRKERRVADLPLIVEHGSIWRVLDGERYLDVSRDLSAVEVGRLHPSVDTLITTESGSRYMTPTEVYGAHGVTARKIRWTYDATGPTWDAVERVLCVPGARVRAGTARRSENVESWLHVLVPAAQLPKLLDWLATAAMLSRPTSAPQLRGPGSAGKAMLAAALTCWLGGRVDYKHATSDFNAGLIHGPLVLLDEGVAESQPDAFRSLTGNLEHQVVAKNRMPEELIGCPRTLVLSNEPDPLQLGREELSSFSEHALGRRILVFDVQQAAADRLAEMGGWDATAGWCDPEGELVCHLRWLAENRAVIPGQRFLVEGDAAEWVASAHTRSGAAANIVQAFASYVELEAEGRTSEMATHQPFMYNPKDANVVGISVRGLQTHWALLMGPAEKVPSHQVLSKALRRMSGLEAGVRMGEKSDRGPRVYPVVREKLEEK